MPKKPSRSSHNRLLRFELPGVCRAALEGIKLLGGRRGRCYAVLGRLGPSGWPLLHSPGMEGLEFRLGNRTVAIAVQLGEARRAAGAARSFRPIRPGATETFRATRPAEVSLAGTGRRAVAVASGTETVTSGASLGRSIAFGATAEAFTSRRWAVAVASRSETIAFGASPGRSVAFGATAEAFTSRRWAVAVASGSSLGRSVAFGATVEAFTSGRWSEAFGAPVITIPWRGRAGPVVAAPEAILAVPAPGLALVVHARAAAAIALIVCLGLWAFSRILAYTGRLVILGARGQGEAQRTQYRGAAGYRGGLLHARFQHGGIPFHRTILR